MTKTYIDNQSIIISRADDGLILRYQAEVYDHENNCSSYEWRSQVLEFDAEQEVSSADFTKSMAEKYTSLIYEIMEHMGDSGCKPYRLHCEAEENGY